MAFDELRPNGGGFAPLPVCQAFMQRNPPHQKLQWPVVTT